MEKKLEIGNWKMENGKWKLEIGNWKMELDAHGERWPRLG
jgi:hypothetical protein